MLVSVLLLFSATWHLDDATSCTALTGNTCQKTSYVTGTCNNGMCACIDGYESTRFGCIEKVKLAITFNASDGRTPEATSNGSGEVFVGGKITLVCTPLRTGETYVWSKDNVDIQSQTNNNITLSNVNTIQGGQYRCKTRLDISDYVSAVSDPATIKVVPVNGTFGNQPVVTGMYKRAMLNAIITLECTNTPSGVGLTYEWYVGGVITNIRTSSYNLTITDKTLSKNVTCKIGQSPPAGSTVLALPESVPVSTPSSLTEDISGVTIVEIPGATIISAEAGRELKLTCAISDTDIAIPAGIVTYRWTKDGTDISQTNTYSKTNIATTDSGVYKCFAKVGARLAKESGALSLDIVQPTEIIGQVITEVVPSGATPLVGGYMSIKCLVEVRNLSRLNYLWAKKDVGFISGQKDGQIQINSVAAKDSGDYQCLVSTELVWGVSAFLTIKPPVTIDTAMPSAPTANKLDKESFGVGNTYVLTCTSVYDSPGLTYRWMEGAQVIAGATSKTYTLTAKSGVTLYSCQIVFNGTASKSSPSLTIDAKNIIGVTVDLAGSTVSGTTIKPLNAAKVTLECKATTAARSSGAAAYAWLKSAQKIQNQATSTYELNAGAASDGEITCNVTVGNETVVSDKVIVTAVAALEAPTLEVRNAILLSGQQVYSEGGTYTLICRTASHTDSVMYIWMKNGTIINLSTERSYTISNARRGLAGDSGVYTCNATLATSTVTSSNNITVAIGEPGRPCKFVTECLGIQYGPSCVNSRCECASGYTATGDTCTSAVTHLTASVLLMMCATLIGWMYQEMI